MHWFRHWPQVEMFCTGAMLLFVCLVLFFVVVFWVGFCWFWVCGFGFFFCDSMRDWSSSGAVTIEHLIRAAELGRRGGVGNWVLFGAGCQAAGLCDTWLVDVATCLWWHASYVNALFSSVKLQPKLEKTTLTKVYLQSGILIFSAYCHVSATSAAATLRFAFLNAINFKNLWKYKENAPLNYWNTETITKTSQRYALDLNNLFSSSHLEEA